MMLRSRGNPQALESFNIPDLVNEIELLLGPMKVQLGQFQNTYIAPDSVDGASIQ